jgi:hypothetical protein
MLNPNESQGIKEPIMNQAIKRLLCFAMAVLFLLNACAPAAAPTQDPALNELLEKMDSLVATQNVPPTQDPTLEELKQQVQTLTAQQQALSEALLNPAEAADASPDAPAPTSPPVAETVSTLPTADCGSASIQTPVILRVDPEQGETYGGKSVTITGTNLVYLCKDEWTNTRFLFGSVPATDVVCENAESCTLKSPRARDETEETEVVIKADNNGIQSEDDNFKFTYLVPPVVEKVSPNSGLTTGGKVVIVTGENFFVDQTEFLFGGIKAKVLDCVGSECQVVTPAMVNANEEVIVWVQAVNGGAYSELNLSPETQQTFKYRATPKYACDAYLVSPKNKTVFGPGDGFRIKWVVKNIGTNAWPAGQDVGYSGGVNMGEISSFEIGYSLQPNDSFTIEIDATAPNQTGLHYMNWSVAGQGCSLYVAIQVE